LIPRIHSTLNMQLMDASAPAGNRSDPAALAGGVQHRVRAAGRFSCNLIAQALRAPMCCVIGAGLAGTEAAWRSPGLGAVGCGDAPAAGAHRPTTALRFAELGLQQQFWALSPDRAAGLLQEEFAAGSDPP